MKIRFRTNWTTVEEIAVGYYDKDEDGGYTFVVMHTARSMKEAGAYLNYLNGGEGNPFPF